MPDCRRRVALSTRISSFIRPREVSVYPFVLVEQVPPSENVGNAENEHKVDGEGGGPKRQLPTGTTAE